MGNLAQSLTEDRDSKKSKNNRWDGRNELDARLDHTSLRSPCDPVDIDRRPDAKRHGQRQCDERDQEGARYKPPTYPIQSTRGKTERPYEPLL